MMSRTSAYSLQIKTHSDDENALLLLADGQLVAVLVELTDAGHGKVRGRWAIEALFGLITPRVPDNFATAEDAARWVGEQLGDRPFLLGDALIKLD